MKNTRTFFISNTVAMKNLSLALINAITVDDAVVIDHSSPVKIRASIRKDENSLDDEEHEDIYEGVLDQLEVTVELKS